MRMKMRILLAIVLVLLIGVAIQAQAQEPAADGPVIYLFWGNGCPHCAREKEFLNDLLRHYPGATLREFEVWYSAENQQLFERFGEAFRFKPGSVPTTFIGNRYWVGFGQNTGSEFVAMLEQCKSGCVDVGAQILAGVSPDQVVFTAPSVETANTVTLPLLGTIELGAQPLWFSTAVISFIDGFNPCSLWVLSILLALVLHSGSRKRTLLVGTTFLVVTATAYIIFITGLFGIFSIIGYLGWIQIAVAAIAFAFALINIKDYFWYKEGVSLTIDDRHKPGLYRNMRGLIAADKSPLALMGATGAVALGVTLLELPCTSGMPVMWTNLLSANNVAGGQFVLLLALYMFIFLIDELALFLAAVFTMKAVKFEEKHGRILKLAGGIVMLALAAVMVIDPALMNDVGASALVFAAALGVTALILFVHRRVMPSLGVTIGSELKPR
jgi:thiol-disulfide isomerase/thioredoxin